MKSLWIASLQLSLELLSLTSLLLVCVAANPLSSVVMNKKGGLHFRKYIRHSLRMYTTREKKVKSNNSEKLLCYVIKKPNFCYSTISLHILNSPVETLFQPSENSATYHLNSLWYLRVWSVTNTDNYKMLHHGLRKAWYNFQSPIWLASSRSMHSAHLKQITFLYVTYLAMHNGACAVLTEQSIFIL